MQSFRSSWGVRLSLGPWPPSRHFAVGIKGGTQGRRQNALIALHPHHDNQGTLVWIDIHGSPSLDCSCEWDLSHDNANSCKIFHVTIPCQLWTEICLGEVPQLTRGIPTQAFWGRGMVRPWPPCQGLVESVALWDQLLRYSWKVVFKNGVILSFSTLKICAKHMKECPKVFCKVVICWSCLPRQGGYCV